MKIFEDTIGRIVPRNKEIEHTILQAWQNATQYGSFGKIPAMVAQYGASTNQLYPVEPKKCMIIAGADHGVAHMGVSAFPIETTVGMMKNYLIPKGAGANAMANYCGAQVEVVDVGVAADLSDVPGLRHHKIRWGTRNMVEEEAMTRAEAIEAMEVGMSLVQEKVAEGYTAFLVGEMGIGNTTSSAIITAKFAGLTAEQATGRGTNISDARLTVKQRVVKAVLEKYEHIPTTDGVGIMAAMGGLEFACLTGVILGCAAHKALLVIDGANTTACALVAHAIAPDCMDYVMASHLSAEKGHTYSLQALGLEAYVDLGFCLGEATGGSIQLEMLNLGIAMYESMVGGEKV